MQRIGLSTSEYTGARVELPENLNEQVALYLREDLGAGDLSAALIAADAVAEARVTTREAAVICGIAWFDAVFRQLDARVETAWSVADGDDVSAEQTLCELRGPTRALLSGERTALNLLQTLSGTATVARDYVRALRGTRTRLLDTRKTIPGLRAAQKYAVRCAGGQNHRMGLFDGVLIKGNHVLAAGSVSAALQHARRLFPAAPPLEIEVETTAQLEEAIQAGADIVLLDNFTIAGLRAAVAVNHGRVPLEASGGFDLSTVRNVAETGVDYVSVGALTKHLRAIDLSFRVVAARASPSPTDRPVR